MAFDDVLCPEDRIEDPVKQIEGWIGRIRAQMANTPTDPSDPAEFRERLQRAAENTIRAIREAELDKRHQHSVDENGAAGTVSVYLDSDGEWKPTPGFRHPYNTAPSPAGDPRFHAVLDELGELHERKARDYGSATDPYANVRASEEWGIPAWVGALVRLNDKVHRLKQFAQKGFLANEAAEDSMIDIAVYAVIALILYREAGAED